MRRAVAATLASAVLALSFSPPLTAGPFEDGMAAYDKGDHSTAMRYWRGLADQGNPAAQSNLALMYFKGQGVPRDYVQAYMWLNICGAKGDSGCVDQRDLLAQKLKGKQLAAAQRLASEWQPKKEHSAQ